MLAENTETALAAAPAMRDSAPDAKSTKVRAPDDAASSRRGRKKGGRRVAPPRSVSSSSLVELPTEVDANGEPVVSASQALIDLEIRRSMREARRARDQQLQQQVQQPKRADSAGQSPVLQVNEEQREGPRPGGNPSPSLDVDAAAEAQNPNEESGLGQHETRTRQHGHGSREAGTQSNQLNQHFALMTQQLTAAHRVIGRVAAERDALRQQLADLQGIPVEDVVIATTGNPAEGDAERRPQPAEEAVVEETPSLMAKLNYFGGEDVAQMRRRRQSFVLTLLGTIFLGAIVARQIGWSMPEDISRDSLAALPVLGNFMYVFLAGWMLFRVIKVSSKGVRWVFPSEDRRRRRR